MATPSRGAAAPPAPETTSRSRRAGLRGLTLVLAGALGIAISPLSASADEPATSQQAAALVAARGAELESVTEDFNTARETLAAAQQTAQQAADQATRAEADRQAAQSHVAGVARSAYTGSGMSSLAALMTSRDPDDFVDRVATLETVAGHQNDVLDAAVAASRTAADARTAAAAAAGAAQHELDDVTRQQADLQGQIATYQADFDRLSAQEKRAAQDAMAAAAAQQAQARAAAAASAASAAGSGGSGGSAGSAGLAGGTGARDSSAKAASRADRTTPAGSDAAAAPDAPDAPVAAGSGAGAAAVRAALAQRGKPYVWAAAGPGSFDCSGLMQYAYKAAGVSLPHSSSMQSRMGTAVSRSQLQPGDLVFFYSPVSHVGMYIGNGQMVHAPTSGDVVKVASLDAMGTSPVAYRHFG